MLTIMVFDFENGRSCITEIGTFGGKMSVFGKDEGYRLVDKILKFIAEYASRNGLKVSEIDSQLKTIRSDLLYPSMRESFLRECVKCAKRIPIASEECKYCGAHQP